MPADSHTISLLVADKPGVLVRISLVFARRSYNIESLVVSSVTGSEPKQSRMTITCSGDADTLDQIVNQLGKLIDVIQVIDHTGGTVIEKEMALIKVKCSASDRTQVLQICEHFRGQTVDFGADSMVLEFTGGTDKLDSIIGLLRPLGIVELIRSGKILMARGIGVT